MPEFCRVGLPNSQVKLLWSASSLNCQSLDTHEVVRILFRVPGMITILLFAICFSTRNLRELPHLRSLTRSVCVCVSSESGRYYSPLTHVIAQLAKTEEVRPTTDVLIVNPNEACLALIPLHFRQVITRGKAPEKRVRPEFMHTIHRARLDQTLHPQPMRFQRNQIERILKFSADPFRSEGT